MIRDLPPGEWYGDVEHSLELGGIILSVVSHAEARIIAPHRHARSYFTLPYAGRYRETYEGVTIEYEPFSMAFHPAGFVHSDVILAPDKFFSVSLNEDWEARMSGCFDFSAWRFELQHGEAVWLAVRLLQRLLSNEILDQLEVETAVSEMLGIALRLGEPKGPARKWVSDLKDLLRDRYDEHVSLDRLSARLGLHPASLSRGFRLEEGITVGEFLTRVRVQHACRFMMDKRASLASVAAACGFADQSHLTRAFKTLTGSSPGVFRELLAVDSPHT